jgi:2-polyprenyl-3-methyl-5-hydroxy-6-metoxy-1,4-benzoquinol methylase
VDTIRAVKNGIHRVGSSYVRLLNRLEYRRQRFSAVNERPVEYRYVFQQLAALSPRSVLDVGTGQTSLPHLMRSCGFVVTAIDNVRDYWRQAPPNTRYHVIDDDITHSSLKACFDFVSCISVLEHIRKHSRAVHSMLDRLHPGGHLVVTFPYHEKHYVADAYALPESTVSERHSFVTQVFSRRELDSWLADGRAEIIDQEYWRFFTGHWWTCGERVTPPVRVARDEPHQLTCLTMRKRWS